MASETRSAVGSDSGPPGMAGCPRLVLTGLELRGLAECASKAWVTSPLDARAQRLRWSGTLETLQAARRATDYDDMALVPTETLDAMLAALRQAYGLIDAMHAYDDVCGALNRAGLAGYAADALVQARAAIAMQEGR